MRRHRFHAFVASQNRPELQLFSHFNTSAYIDCFRDYIEIQKCANNDHLYTFHLLVTTFDH